jgi:hypothetical protein
LRHLQQIRLHANETNASWRSVRRSQRTARRLNELLEKLWGALTPELLVVVAVFEPGRLADAAIRHEVSAWV